MARRPGPRPPPQDTNKSFPNLFPALSTEHDAHTSPSTATIPKHQGWKDRDYLDAVRSWSSTTRQDDAGDDDKDQRCSSGPTEPLYTRMMRYQSHQLACNAIKTKKKSGSEVQSKDNDGLYAMYDKEMMQTLTKQGIKCYAIQLGSTKYQ